MVSYTFLLLAALVAAASGATVTSCQADGWFPDKWSLTPEEPCPGDNIAFNATGVNDKYDHIDGGKMKVGVALDGYPLTMLTWDLCDHEGLQLKCPIVKGPFGFVYSQKLPSFIPCGNYQIKLQAEDTQGTELMCLMIDFKVPSTCCAWAEDKIEAVIEQ
eukprot:TRINITY_DN1344_c0_g1_i4.p3 TRINITY_DN1344_c0_g1~~TRINITY_DN1344_c0_g1_i4.p3  ORF type:complete len:160 (-),score=31.13 TRINITY_DN1344_c0_g1_i4:376-855(-)